MIKPSIPISKLEELRVTYPSNTIPTGTLFIVTDPSTEVSKKLTYSSFENSLIRNAGIADNTAKINELSGKVLIKSGSPGADVSVDHWIVCATPDSAASYINTKSHVPSYDPNDPHVLYGIFQNGTANVISGAAASVSTLLSIAFENNIFDKINVINLSSTNLTSTNSHISNLTSFSEQATNLTTTNLTSDLIYVTGKGDIIEFINSSIEHNAAFYVTKDTQGNAFQTYNQLSTQTNAGNLYRSGIRKTPSQNDYCVVLSDETMNSRYPGSYDISSVYSTRYSWVEDTTIPNLSGKWEFKYVINNSPYTKIQWDTINSGISKETVVKHTSNTQIGSPTLPVYVDRNGNINPTPNISVTNLTSTNAHISGLTSNSININGKGDIIKYIDNNTAGAKTSVTIDRQQTSGTPIAKITVDGTTTQLYAPDPVDFKSKLRIWN